MSAPLAWRRWLAVLLLLVLLPYGVQTAITPAQAMTAEEMLDDPALEARARDLSKQLRCLVCQNQSIDDSDAELARDLRREVRSQLVAGATDDEILDLLRGRYGDYVLLRPPVSTGTYLLWLGPLAVVLIGGALVVMARRRSPPSAETDLSPEEGPRPNPAPNVGQTATLPKMVLGLSAGVIAAASLGLYLFLGRADLADQPLAGRQAEIATAEATAADQAADLAAMMAGARDAVQKSPDSVEAWLQLAMVAAQAGDIKAEINALGQALEMTKGDSAVKSMLAEALSRQADGQVTIPARALIDEALASNPHEPRALYLAGLAAYQDEDYSLAVNRWRTLYGLSRPDAPWMVMLEQNIANAARAGGLDLADLPAVGPDSAAVEAAAGMSEAERSAMIENMVEGLARRLDENPDDVAGWQRLARAYDVLGRTEDAAKALLAAADAAPEDPALQITAMENMITGGQDTRFAADAERLLTRLAASDPDRLELLFFRGHFAKLAGEIDSARRNWQRLLERLPEDSPHAANLKAQIDKL